MADRKQKEAGRALLMSLTELLVKLHIKKNIVTKWKVRTWVMS